MILFELTMPHVGSWDGKWSEEKGTHIIVKPEREVRKFLWDQDYYYSWPDGWTCCIKCKRISAAEARKLASKSSGFCGYNWMVDSIIHYGSIMTKSEQIEYLQKQLEQK